MKVVCFELMERNWVMIIFFLVLLCQLIKNDATSPTFVNTSCVGDFNYTKNSAYALNLNSLLSNLSSLSSVVKFNNLTVGEGGDKVYGLFQCRQDITIDVCSRCIQDATQQIMNKCKLYGEANMWYYECMLRYSNRNIFALMEMLPSYDMWLSKNASNEDMFIDVLSDTMDGVIKAASASSPSGHFATREGNLTFPEKLYCLAQCTPDISTFDCNSCLRNALALINGYCTGCIQGKNFSPSCQLWYDLTPFYLKATSDPIPAANATPSPLSDIKPQHSHTSSKMKRRAIAGIVIGVTAGVLLLFAGIWFCIWRGNTKKRKEPPIVTPRETSKEAPNHGDNVDDAGVQQYNFATLNTATRDFSSDNKLGEGGFSAVYKGVLKTGQTVTIKRLSGKSGHSRTEFMTKAHMVAQLKHKNIVQLIGVCSEGYEKLLVYEFMPNPSLGHFLFEPRKRALLVWETRHKIIIGIARGLQYLHEDSQLTIIHRDLKPSNILLDADMNAKIDDFDMATLFGGQKNVKNTSGAIVGTYGYMAPEYVLQREYSDKSDIYSFGIIILEILSGQKNLDYYQVPHKEDLLLYSWKLWKAGQALDIMDPILLNKYPTDEVMRCIQIGLLCVQADPINRPAIGKVILMLNGLLALPTPSSPAIPSVDLRLPLNDTDGGWQNDTQESNTKSVTWKIEELEQDLYPRI